MRGASSAFFLSLLLPALPAMAADAIDRERQQELVRLVRNDCGSCHGMTLSGGLGPSLLPAALSGKAPEGLRETILRGRTGTAMPPWASFVTEAEAHWIVEKLMNGFPDVF